MPFHIIDDFLPLASYQALCRLVKKTAESGQLVPAKIGQKNKKHNVDIRKDLILWLDDTTNHDGITSYFHAIETLKTELNQTLFLGLIDYEAHFAVYPPGSFYKKHTDQFTGTNDRQISCVYYLNEDWQHNYGGELVLYHNTKTAIIPQGNRFVCFNSNIPHEVLTTHKTRYSITTWLKVRSLDLRRTL